MPLSPYFFLTFYKYVEFLNILYESIHHLQYLFEIVWH